MKPGDSSCHYPSSRWATCRGTGMERTVTAMHGGCPLSLSWCDREAKTAPALLLHPLGLAAARPWALCRAAQRLRSPGERRMLGMSQEALPALPNCTPSHQPRLLSPTLSASCQTPWVAGTLPQATASSSLPMMMLGRQARSAWSASVCRDA